MDEDEPAPATHDAVRVDLTGEPAEVKFCLNRFVEALAGVAVVKRSGQRLIVKLVDPPQK